jgi:AcrR family transcriptional regulator
VIEAAARIADAEGLDAVTLARVAAELDVRPPSLFNHVDGLSGVRRGLQLRGLRELTATATRAAVGRAGEDAVLATAQAVRQFAAAHPGLYAASLPATRPDDPDLEAAGAQFIGIFFDAMRKYGFEGEEAVHAVRGLFSAVHGFIMLERAGTFAMPIETDASFDWLIRRYIEALDLPTASPASSQAR